MGEQASFIIEDAARFKRKVVSWAQQFEFVLCLDSNQHQNEYQVLDFVIAIDALESIRLSNETNPFALVEAFHKKVNTKIFGYLSYDLKNELEDLHSSNPDYLSFPTSYFFVPRYIIEVKEGRCFINRSTLEALYILDQIEAFHCSEDEVITEKITWKTRVDHDTYIQNVEAIQQDIIEGTVYELNYCREIYAETANFKPLESYLKINEATKAPFTSFLKLQSLFALCFSPERFMQLKEGEMLSQPIKGTVKKTDNFGENERLKHALFNDEKERAENVMIVDLVRNDFARSAKPGSVKVKELFGIYEFENIIQMISTVTAQKRNEMSSWDALKNAFPMGSMTGAPKIKSMELIEKYENTKRNLYSGAMGYIDADGNFDFNVVIRTLCYNANKQYLSMHVGGAITIDSIPQKEWEETETKAQSILKFL